MNLSISHVWPPITLAILLFFPFFNCSSAQPRPDLVLGGTVAPTPVSIGELVTFSLNITNRGNASASQVVLTSSCSSNGTLFDVAASAGSVSQSGKTVTCALGSLPVGAGATLRIRVTPLAAGDLTNSATATQSETDSNSANNTVIQVVPAVPYIFYSGPNLNIARAYHTATLLPEGKVLITGGNTATGWTATAELYDPQTRTFTLAASMQRARAQHTATRLNDGRVLIVGIAQGYMHGAEIYNPTNNTFTSIGNTMTPHQAHSATLLNDGRVLIANDSYTYPFNTAEVFVPALNVFTNLPNTIYGGTKNQGIRLDDGRVLLAGGAPGGSYSPATQSEIFNPVTGTFSPVGEMTRNRTYYGAAKLPDGRIFYVGGISGGQQSADLFYTNSQTFQAVSNATRAVHYFATANLLSNGTVLVTGYSKQAELFNPTNNGFMRTVEMQSGRNYSTATTLADGTVLIAGGLELGTFAVLATTELYDPARTRPPPAISISDAVTVEGNDDNTNLTFNLTLSSPMGVPVSVGYSTAEWNATEGYDYAATNGTVLFSPGITNQTIRVTVFGEGHYEGDERLTVNLSNPTNAVLDVASGSGTILNDDPLPILTAVPASRHEGNRLTTNLVFNLYLSRASAQSISVDYTTADGTALAGLDYVATNGTAYFPGGITNTSVNVILIGDTQIEPDEVFHLHLSNVVNAVQGTASATGTILDDDGSPGWLHHFDITLPPAPLFADSPLLITVMARDVFGNPTTNVNGRALLSVGTTGEAPMFFGFEDGVLGDWIPSNGGSQPGPYEIKFFDINRDGDASFAFRTAAGHGTDGITRSVTLTGGKRYYVSADVAQSNEGGGPNGGDTQAYLSLGGFTLASTHFGGVNNGDVLWTNLTGSFNAPFTGQQSLGLLFARDPWSETYPVGAFADDVVLGAAPITPRFTATFTNGIWIGPVSIGIPGSNFVIYARGLEGHPGVSSAFNLEWFANVGLLSSFAPATPAVGSDLIITITATNRGPGVAPMVVLTNVIPLGPLFVSATSTAGSCVVSDGVITCNFGPIAANQSASMSLTLRPTRAGLITNFAALAPSIYDQTASDNFVSNSITIGPAQIIVINPPAVMERVGGTTNAVFEVTVSDPHSDTITVDYATANVTAVAGVDYMSSSGLLSFPPGVSTQTVSISVLDDTLAEVNETFRLQLSNPTQAQLTGAGFGTGTILDNGDPVPVASINDVILLEGDSSTTNALFTVTLDRPAGYPITLNYATTNGSAIAPGDYVPFSSSMTIPAGQVTGTFSIGVRGDMLNEPDELFYVSLTISRQSPPVLLQRTQASITILNDDAVPGRLNHFEWTVGFPRIRNLPFPVTVTARDAFNNIATNIPISALLTATNGLKQSVPITPTQTTPFINGVWNGQITIHTAGSNVVLYARDNFQHTGASLSFDVLSAIGVTLTAPASINETNGSMPAQGMLSVSLPRGTNTTFNLGTSDSSELTVPSTLLLPANATNVAFDITAVDDSLLDGTKMVMINASATGYNATKVDVAVHDDEIATLAVSVPDKVIEGVEVLGTVIMNALAGDTVFVNLTSTVPSQLQVPLSVPIYAGQSSNTFTITPVNDGDLDGPQSAEIVARVENWTDGAATVIVQDNETNTATIAFAPPGPLYYEGSGSVSGASVRLGGIVTSNVTVFLQSSDTTEAIVPASVEVSAGTNSVFLPLTIPDDDLFDGTQTALIIPHATGFFSEPVAVSIGDNELHHFSLEPMPANVEATVAVPLKIVAKDVNDSPLVGFAEMIGLSATNANGAVPLSPTLIAFSAGQWSGNVTFPNWEYSGVRLIASSGEVRNISSVFNVVPPTLSVVNVAGSGLVYSPLNGRFYVNTTTGLLIPIHAHQSQVEPSINIGNLGTKMVASDDGQFLYLERTGGNLCRFNVAANTADLFWSSGVPMIEDMAAVPGWAEAVAVSRMDTSTSPRTRGTIIYSNAIALPNTGGGNLIEFASNPPRLYAYNNEAGCGVAGYNVNPNGLSVASGAAWSCYSGDYVGSGGLLFWASGEIFNPDRSIVIGNHSSGSAVAGNIDEGRCYFWQQSGANQSSIVARDLHTLVPIGSTALPGVSSATGRLIRWGTNGLAFRHSGTGVVIVRSSLVPSGAPADLVLTQLTPSDATTIGGVYTCTFAISNAGPNFATNVVFSATLPPTTILSSISAPDGVGANPSGGVTAQIASIAPGAASTVTLALTPIKPGPFAFKASVLSGAADPNLTNNRLTLDVPGLFVSGYDTIVDLTLPTTDLVYDKVHERICASVPNTNELLGNSIITFDPLSAFYPSPIRCSAEPGKLAVADDGQYLYSSAGGETAIQRIDLNTRVADLKFPTGYGGVNDLEVMPGHAEVVAATVHTTIVVYENGVARTKVVGPTEYNFGYSLEFGASSNRLYASFPWGFRRVNVDATGATLIEDVRDTLIVGYNYDMDFGSGLIYSAGGRVFNPETKAMVATLPYTGLPIAGPSSAYAYYLTTSGSTATIRVIDMPTRVEIKAIHIPGVVGSVSSFIRWGNDGFAFRTSGGQVFLVRATIVDDQDADGMADTWEKLYFGSTNGAGGGVNDDPDSDGFSNYNEFAAGTNPLDSQSTLRIASVNWIGGQPRIAFSTATGKRYRIERRNNLGSGAWTTVHDNLIGTGSMVEVNDPAASYAGGFYRLVLMP